MTARVDKLLGSPAVRLYPRGLEWLVHQRSQRGLRWTEHSCGWSCYTSVYIVTTVWAVEPAARSAADRICNFPGVIASSIIRKEASRRHWSPDGPWRPIGGEEGAESNG